MEGHTNGVLCLFFSSGGHLVSGSYDGTVRKWSLETGQPLWVREVGGGWVSSVAELPDRRVFAGCDDGTVRVLDGNTGAEIMVCRGHTFLVRSVISLGDHPQAGVSFASGSWNRNFRVWASDGGLVRVVGVREGAVSLSLSLAHWSSVEMFTPEQRLFIFLS